MAVKTCNMTNISNFQNTEKIKMSDIFALVLKSYFSVLYIHLKHPLLTLMVNLAGFVLMWMDKRRAQNRQWRLEESVLVLPVLVGGIGGVLAGMWNFRHKTRKMKFQDKIILCAIAWPFIMMKFWSRRACVRHTWWRTKRSWPLFSPTFFFFLFSSSPPSTFHPLRGISRA